MHQFLKFILFWNNTLHVSDGLSVHHQEFQDCTYSIRYMSYRFCGYLLASSHRTCMTYTWCCVYSLGTPDFGRKDLRNM